MRNLIGIALFVLALALIGAWCLGDKFGPAVEVARDNARDRLLAIVDQEKLSLKTAEMSVAKAEAAAAKTRRAVAAGRVKASQIAHEIAICSRAIQREKADLASIEARLVSDQHIVLISGRKLTLAEATDRVSQSRERLALATEKLGFLEKLHVTHQHRARMLEIVHRQFPGKLAGLRQSVVLLREKIAAAEQYSRWVDEFSDDDSAKTALMEAQESLEAAHAATDRRLIEVDVFLETLTGQNQVAAVTEESESGDADELIAEIRDILDDPHDGLSVTRVDGDKSGGKQ